jgi:hypothetical protein
MSLTGTSDRMASIKNNGWTKLLASKVEDAKSHGVACFDHVFYVKANHYDLQFIEKNANPQVNYRSNVYTLLCSPLSFLNAPDCTILFCGEFLASRTDCVASTIASELLMLC